MSSASPLSNGRRREKDVFTGSLAPLYIVLSSYRIVLGSLFPFKLASFSPIYWTIPSGSKLLRFPFSTHLLLDHGEIISLPLTLSPFFMVTILLFSAKSLSERDDPHCRSNFHTQFRNITIPWAPMDTHLWTTHSIPWQPSGLWPRLSSSTFSKLTFLSKHPETALFPGSILAVSIWSCPCRKIPTAYSITHNIATASAVLHRGPGCPPNISGLRLSCTFADCGVAWLYVSWSPVSGAPLSLGFCSGTPGLSVSRACIHNLNSALPVLLSSSSVKCTFHTTSILPCCSGKKYVWQITASSLHLYVTLKWTFRL